MADSGLENPDASVSAPESAKIEQLADGVYALVKVYTSCSMKMEKEHQHMPVDHVRSILCALIDILRPDVIHAIYGN